MSMLSKEFARNSETREKTLVDVTELGPIGPDGKPEKTVVWVRALTAKEKDDFENSCVRTHGRKRKVDMSNMRARMAVLCCVDGNDNLIFGPDDWKWLTHKSAKALSRIFNAAKDLNDISDEDEEELLKNSEATPTCDS